MGDEDRDRSPSQGVRDAIQPGPPSSSPVISAGLPQRIQESATAERSDAAAQAREPEPPLAGEVTTPAVESEAEGNGAAEAVRDGRERTNGARRTRMRGGVTGPGRAAQPEVNASFRPVKMVTVVLAGGQAVLRVEVNAPSPLGVFAATGSP